MSKRAPPPLTAHAAPPLARPLRTHHLDILPPHDILERLGLVLEAARAGGERLGLVHEQLDLLAALQDLLCEGRKCVQWKWGGVMSGQ